MLHFIANGVVLLGIVLLLFSFSPVRKLIVLLPQGRSRFSWYVLTALTFIFVAGYVIYIPVFWGSHEKLADLVVPVVFFLGACFVLMVNFLSLQTARDVRYLAVLEQENITDPVLGIYNRRYLDRRLSTEISRASRYGMTLSVLLIDIDHFKRINDTYGHPVGDVVLRGLAQLIVNTVRTTDIVARYGGEEIMVIAPSTPVKTAAQLAERLRKAVEESPLSVPPDMHRELDRVRITVSVGVACFGRNANDIKSLILNADKAMYRAKNEGRNRVVTCAPDG